MKTWAERVLASERSIDPCGHHGCALSAGCGEMTDCCTRCPLPDCRHGDGAGNYGPMSASFMKRIERDRVIVGLKAEGVPVDEIAEVTNLSKRRVWHVLAEV